MSFLKIWLCYVEKKKTTYNFEIKVKFIVEPQFIIGAQNDRMSKVKSWRNAVLEISNCPLAPHGLNLLGAS